MWLWQVGNSSRVEEKATSVPVPNTRKLCWRAPRMVVGGAIERTVSCASQSSGDDRKQEEIAYQPGGGEHGAPP